MHTISIKLWDTITEFWILLYCPTQRFLLFQCATFNCRELIKHFERLKFTLMKDCRVFPYLSILSYKWFVQFPHTLLYFRKRIQCIGTFHVLQDISDNNLGREGAKVLAAAIKENDSIMQINAAGWYKQRRNFPMLGVFCC